jgi:hypothetical protein
MTLEEIESAEGGTILESKVGMAAARRAMSRKTAAAGSGKGGGDDSTDIPSDVNKFEEAAEVGVGRAAPAHESGLLWGADVLRR